jgi:hypothetical protein
VTYFSLIRDDRPLLVHLVYLGINLAVGCIVIGYISGSTWQCHDSFHKDCRPIYINKNDGKDTPYGHILFAGSAGILLFDFGQKHVRLVRSSQNDDIFECKSPQCKERCGGSGCDEADATPRPEKPPASSPAAQDVSRQEPPRWCRVFYIVNNPREWIGGHFDQLRAWIVPRLE